MKASLVFTSILFAVVLLVSCDALAGQPAEFKLCDLSVLYIQRTPRYQAYLVEYGFKGKEGLPQLARFDKNGKRVPMTKDEIAATKFWPDEGEEVTYTAVVENKGTVDARPFEYAWYVDGKEVISGKTKANLAPGKRFDFTYKRPWKKETCKIEFRVDPMRRVRQFSFVNDKRQTWTHAKLLICMADRITYEQFAKHRNFLGTYNFEDWCQEHMRWMNHLFAESVYPDVAPNGILDRVNIDYIGIVETPKAWQNMWTDGPTVSKGWDGGWWFGPNPDCSRWAANMDWGLIHEWGHQLGLTDLYALDVASETCQVLGRDGMPLLIGRMSPFTHTMMHGHGPVIFSADQAVTMNHQLWRRRGFYGDYYYNLAEKNYILVTDSTGKPVPNAKLRFWQRNEMFKGKPTFIGKTDKDGKFLLKNRPAPKVKTHGYPETGYIQKPNPFGQIHVVGVNGVFFTEIEARGQVDYTYFDISELNLARARGTAKIATYKMATTLPADNAPKAPPAPKLAVDGRTVTLKLPDAGNWTVLRADQPHFKWKAIGKVTDGGQFVDELRHAGLYRYAAVIEADGKVSARSPLVGVAIMGRPHGLAVGKNGECYVRDVNNLQTLLIRPDGSAVGFVGSVHWHLEWSWDHAMDAKGSLYIIRWPNNEHRHHHYLLKVDPNGTGREYDRKFVIGGRDSTMNLDRFREPKGVWVSKDAKTIVIADTGHDRVEISDENGNVKPGGNITGLNQPYRAMIVDDKLVVCDTGAKRVAIFEFKAGKWQETVSIDGFDKPIYCCQAGSGKIWIADAGLGRVVEISLKKTAQKTGRTYPAADKPKIDELAGIAYDPTNGDLLYLNSKAKRLVRVKMPK